MMAVRCMIGRHDWNYVRYNRRECLRFGKRQNGHPGEFLEMVWVNTGEANPHQNRVRAMNTGSRTWSLVKRLISASLENKLIGSRKECFWGNKTEKINDAFCGKLSCAGVGFEPTKSYWAVLFTSTSLRNLVFPVELGH